MQQTRRLHVAVTNEDSSDSKVTQQQQQKKLQIVKQAKDKMLKRGMDRATARQILRTWKNLGVSDAQQLRKLLVDNSMRNVMKVVVQLLFDGVASAWSFYSASQVSQAPELGNLQFPLQLLLSFTGFYFAIGALLNITTLGAVAATANQYRNNAEEVLLAMEELAAAPSGASNLVAAAGQAVDMLKVVQALNEISELLKERLASGKVDTADLFSDLSAYLTLEKAESQGFSAADYELTDQQAADIATVFNRYDTNGDGKLDLQEMQRLCDATFATPLSREEVAAAVKLLDRNADGSIQFDEFCSWWIKEVEYPSNA